MPIGFNSISLLNFVPGHFVEIDMSRARQGLAVLPNRVLVIGARRSTGTIAQNTLVQVKSKDEGPVMFGRGSQNASILTKLKRNNGDVEVWAIGVDVAGTAATKLITVTGSATSDGTLHFLAGDYPVDVAVANGDSQNTIATAIDTAFALYEADWMYTFGVATNVVTGTCRHAAEFGQDFSIQINYRNRQVLDMPSGVTIAISDGVSGATNPSVENALAALADEWFTTIICGFNDDANIDRLTDFAETQWGPFVQQDLMIWVGHRGSFSDHTTYVDAYNSQFLAVIPTGSDSPNAPWEWAAAFAGTSTSDPDPARPRQGMKIAGILPPTRANRYDRSERNLLIQAGISSWTADKAGDVYMERVVTTYLTNAGGAVDPSMRNLETMLTVAAYRYTTRVHFATKYPRHKLASDGADYDVGQPVMTPSVARAEMLFLYKSWIGKAWAENFDEFKRTLIVERNADDPDRLDFQWSPDLINQFRIGAHQMQPLL
jgi:phage tail sheath gpL-like